MKKGIFVGALIGLVSFAGLVGYANATGINDLTEKAKKINGCVIKNFGVLTQTPLPHEKMKNDYIRKIGNELGQYLAERLVNGDAVILLYDQFNLVICEGPAVRQLSDKVEAENEKLEKTAESVRNKANAVSGAINSLRWLKDTIQSFGR